MLRNFSVPTPPPPLTKDATLICCVNVREIFADKRACWVMGGGVGGGEEGEHTQKLNTRH